MFAVWGTPVAHEDDAERAVRCALELIEAIELLGSDAGLPGLAARAGVLTGEVAVNEGGPTPRLVAGDLVNTASRFQTAAEPRTVYVGESTYLATSQVIAYRPVGELTLKGKEEPVRAWQATRVIGDRQSVDQGVEAPFVGRAAELRTLKDALESVREECRIRLVSVTGIPGIGKSRLSTEFFKYVEGIARNHYWHEGRSPAYGEGISFWALAEMVRMRARISDEEGASSSRTKLGSVLTEFVDDESERDWIGERLSHLLGLSEAPGGSREETFSAWRRFFELIAQRDPVVMVFEDLQWADSGLVDFIESLLEWSRNYPILIVTLARPELFERRPNWGAGQRNFTSIHLEPLINEAMRELLFGLVVDLPETVANRILERSEGVPLYAVEIVRMLSAKGLLVEDDGAYRASGDLGDIELPDSLHALVASRLDVLPPDGRGLLQDASVLGKSFSIAALAAVVGRGADELESRMRDLVRREFLTVDLDPRSPERGEYGFLQSVIREVAYSTLSRRDRREKHLAAAKYFASFGDDELAGVVASHYLEAYRASPDGSERDDLASEASGFLADAGRRALSLGAPELARSYFEQSLEITPMGHAHAELTVLAARAAQSAFEIHRSVELADQAIVEFEALGDRESVAEVVARFGFDFAEDRGSFADSIAQAEKAYGALGEDSSAAMRGRLAATIAGLQTTIGEIDQPLEWSERALSLIQQTDDDEGLISALEARSFVLFRTGRRRESVILMRGAIDVAEASAMNEKVVEALAMISIYSLDDDPRDVARRAAEGGRDRTKVGPPSARDVQPRQSHRRCGVTRRVGGCPIGSRRSRRNRDSRVKLAFSLPRVDAFVADRAHRGPERGSQALRSRRRANRDVRKPSIARDPSLGAGAHASPVRRDSDGSRGGGGFGPNRRDGDQCRRGPADSGPGGIVASRHRRRPICPRGDGGHARTRHGCDARDDCRRHRRARRPYAGGSHPLRSGSSRLERGGFTPPNRALLDRHVEAARFTS